MNSESWWWGRSASIDLHGCEPVLVRDPKILQRFVKQLTKVLKMRRVGPAEIKRFGHGQLRGYSVMQFIETSTVTAHFDEHGQRAFIDVFSCQRYDPKTVAKFCKTFFNARDAKIYTEERV
ncbi:MAG: S-adenosylmethionine decarboxylase [Nanoarchaeota archaeon]